MKNEEKRIEIDAKAEFLSKEIKKYKQNIRHLKNLISEEEQFKKEQNIINNNVPADQNLLLDLQTKVRELEKELLLKELELRLHKNRNKPDEKDADEINFDHYYKETPLEWKQRFTCWKNNIEQDISFKKDKKDTKTFIPYKRDVLLWFIYDVIGKKIVYPFNCFFISILLIPFVILPFYFILGPESFYIADETIGVLESTTFMMTIVLIPSALIILKKIFDKYEQTFKDLRNVAKVSNKEYQEFISLSNWTLQSPSVKYFWIGSWIFIIIFGIYFYNNPKPTDLIDDVGIFGLFSMIVVYMVNRQQGYLFLELKELLPVIIIYIICLHHLFI